MLSWSCPVLVPKPAAYCKNKGRPNDGKVKSELLPKPVYSPRPSFQLRSSGLEPLVQLGVHSSGHHSLVLFILSDGSPSTWSWFVTVLTLKLGLQGLLCTSFTLDLACWGSFNRSRAVMISASVLSWNPAFSCYRWDLSTSASSSVWRWYMAFKGQSRSSPRWVSAAGGIHLTSQHWGPSS